MYAEMAHCILARHLHFSTCQRLLSFEVCLLENPVKLRQNACLVICSMCAIADTAEPDQNISKLQGKMSYHSTAADLC